MKKILYILIFSLTLTNMAFADTCSNCNMNEFNVYCVGFNGALVKTVAGEDASRVTVLRGITYIRDMGQGMYGEKTLEFIARGAQSFDEICQATNMKSQDCQDTLKECAPLLR